MRELSLAPLGPDPSVEEVWRVAYKERARGSVWADEYGSAGADDAPRLPAAVDLQNTFCIAGFELFVAAAARVDDNRRLCEFIYRNLGAITQIVRSTRTRRCRSSTRPGSSTQDGPPRRTRSSRPRTWRPAAGGHPAPEPRVEQLRRALLAATRALGRGREVRADDLAVPRDARRDRPRARLRGRGGVFFHGIARASRSRLPGEGRDDARPSTTRCSARR